MKKKLAGENINLEEFPEEVLEFIASKFNSNVRTLEGALKRLIFYATINNSDFTIELANEALRDLFRAEQKNSKVDVNNIIKEVGAYYDVSVADILSSAHMLPLVQIQRVLCFTLAWHAKKTSCASLSHLTISTMRRTYQASQKRMLTSVYLMRNAGG